MAPVVVVAVASPHYIVSRQQLSIDRIDPSRRVAESPCRQPLHAPRASRRVGTTTPPVAVSNVQKTITIHDQLGKGLEGAAGNRARENGARLFVQAQVWEEGWWEREALELCGCASVREL
jgi:hypothetical protein